MMLIIGTKSHKTMLLFFCDNFYSAPLLSVYCSQQSSALMQTKKQIPLCIANRESGKIKSWPPYTVHTTIHAEKYFWPTSEFHHLLSRNLSHFRQKNFLFRDPSRTAFPFDYIFSQIEKILSSLKPNEQVNLQRIENVPVTSCTRLRPKTWKNKTQIRTQCYFKSSSKISLTLFETLSTHRLHDNQQQINQWNIHKSQLLSNLTTLGSLPTTQSMKFSQI